MYHGYMSVVSSFLHLTQNESQVLYLRCFLGNSHFLTVLYWNDNQFPLQPPLSPHSSSGSILFSF